MSGERADGKLWAQSGKILRKRFNPGQTNIQRRRPLSFTAADPAKRPVPGWHGSSYQKVSERFSPSKEAGKNGIRRISPSNRSKNIRPEMEKKDDENDEKRFGPF
jgi:hypothetical protein